MIPIKISATEIWSPIPSMDEVESAGTASAWVAAAGEGVSGWVGFMVGVAGWVFEGVGGTGVIKTPSRINSFSFG